MRSSRTLLALVMSASACGWLGCNALAGIDEGELVAGDSGGDVAGHADSGADSADSARGDSSTTVETGADATSEAGGDSTVGDSTTPDSTSDVTTADTTSVDTSTTDATEASVDAPAEAVGTDATDGPVDSPPPPPPTLGCSIIAGSQTVVDDLSTLGGSNLQFAPHIWIAQRDANASAYVFAQRQADQTEFFDYEVDFTSNTSTPTPVPGLGSTVTLLDVVSADTTNTALAAYGSGGSTSALEIIPLPYGNGSPGPGWSLPSATLPYVATSGELLAGTPESYIVYGNTSTTYTLSAGQGTQGGSGALVTLLQSSSPPIGNASNLPFVSLGGTTYAVLETSSGNSEVAYPSNASSAGTSTPVTLNGPQGAIFGMQVDPTNAANVEAVALNLPDGVTLQLWAGSIPQASLVPLSIGAPQFTQGSVLQLEDFPSGDSSHLWMGSEFLAAGAPGDNSGGLVLLWVGPNGRAVSRATTSGKLITTSNSVTGSALQVLDQVGELEATLAIAWVEQITPDAGPSFQRLYAAEVSCTPLPSGD